uniref:Uncharacterized protein n=1 Tax=Oryza meridionalis TaxID=40149 RepID=A0A0E0DBT2_9ORYZ
MLTNGVAAATIFTVTDISSQVGFRRHKKIEEERRKADTAIDASADEVLVHWVSSASHLVTIKPVRYNNVEMRRAEPTERNIN